MQCPLCRGSVIEFFRDEKISFSYFLCKVCDLRFLDPKAHLSRDEEKVRYDMHNNDVEDAGYLKFMKPLLEIIRQDPQNQTGAGLDYGCGPGPIITHELMKENFKIHLYDPYFYPQKEVLEDKYDYIFATEVVEHFYHPGEEFSKLHGLLKQAGTLYIMTLFYEEHVPFADWYYRKDPTHVCFYSQQTLQWIQKQWGYQSLEVHQPRIAVFKK